MAMTAEGESKQGLGHLFYYVLLATGLAFFNRAMPTPFLPLVLSHDFHQTFSRVGLVMAMYPLGALVSTPWASALACGTAHIVRLHSLAIYSMAAMSLLMASSEDLLLLTGPLAATLLVITFRVCQGVSQAYYLAANTSLITRHFSNNIAYVVGMMEVAVGTGAQLGRLFGGFLYDAGGFWCPFSCVAILQLVCASIGLLFPEKGAAAVTFPSLENSSVAVTEVQPERLPWADFCTLRVSVAMAGVFVSYLMTGLFDATLPQHLEARLGPLSVGLVSAVSSIRSLVYLATSWVSAHLLHSERVSFEMMEIVGFSCVIMGLLTVAPQSIFIELEPMAAGSTEPSAVWAWTIEIISLVITSLGNALLFVPGLPMMQSDVRNLGPCAAEQVSLLFMGAMSAGEATGPILGGALREYFGFRATTAIFAALLLPLVTLAALAQNRTHSELERPLMSRQTSFADETLDLINELTMPIDCESAYRFRRLPYVLKEAKTVPNTAPSLSFRRNYQKQPDPVAHALTVPSKGRRSFQADTTVQKRALMAADYLPKPSRLGSKEGPGGLRPIAESPSQGGK